MRRQLVSFLALPLLLLSVPALGADPGVYPEIGPLAEDGTFPTRLLTLDESGSDPGGVGSLVARPFAASTGYRAEQLWVDRNHQNAIANETCITGSGQRILAGWYLNNERISCYLAMGTSTPMWIYDALGVSAQFDVAASAEAEMLSCTGYDLGTLVWSGYGSSPLFEEDPAYKQDISADGQHLVYYRYGSPYLVCVDTSTGEIEWETLITVTGSQANGVDISADGSRVLLTVYETNQGAQVYSMADGSQVGSFLPNYSQTAAKISGNGERLVTGDFNGRLRLYEYQGSDWTLAGTFYPGGSWVTAVAISEDGHTALGGTLGFNPYYGKVMAVDWPESSAPSQMWVYDNYGDYVTSIDLSSDGSRIIAGSWGQYNATFGDVVTVFDRTGAVIFQLLDDIDEPGSIYSVAMDPDGNFATASGKAVHARLMGNGGEVYSIRIMDALAQDVGVSGISSPPENLQVGQNVTPQVSVTNYGQSAASFNVEAWIYEEGTGVIWSDVEAVSSLAPGATTSVTFSGWTVPYYGSWEFVAATLMPGDQYAGNDSLQLSVRACHDGTVLGFLCPYAENTVFLDLQPLVEVRNNGSYTETIQGTLMIYDPTMTLVYQDSAQVSGMLPGEVETLAFPAWAPAVTGAHQADVTIEVVDDLNPEDNEGSTTFEATYEIIYEDGIWETYYWVGSLDDDMFAVRFSPVLPAPFRVTGARCFVNSTEPFEWFLLCEDDGTGRPDYQNPI
ncbi:hypothetical protein JW921_08225, partial [Candidatus Fermentibacterales bacterium]|nr:hypothetical protein [Candidatus Fermentibacterales bacterium]